MNPAIAESFAGVASCDFCCSLVCAYLQQQKEKNRSAKNLQRVPGNVPIGLSRILQDVLRRLEARIQPGIRNRRARHYGQRQHARPNR